MEDGGYWLLRLALLLILIALNAFFAASEVALISLKPAALRKLAERGPRGLLVQKLAENSGRFLATVQVGVTFAGFLASAFAAESFAHPLSCWLFEHGFTWLGTTTLTALTTLVVTVVISFLSLVFGELVPKQLALKYAENVAYYSAGPIHVFSRLTAPFVWVLNASVNGVLKLLRIEQEQQEQVTEEEIRMMVDMGEETGVIETDERDMIKNVFEFSDITAGEVMTHRTEVVALSIDATPEEVEKTLMGCGFSRVPVYRETIDDIVGLLHFRDYFTAKINGDAAPAIAELLSPVYLAPETMKANLLFRNMQKKKISMAVILDEFGGTSGIVSLEDLLEEIVGDLYDEFDTDADGEAPVRISENVWRVDGAMRLDELAEFLHQEITLAEGEEYDTVGGLIFGRLNAVPTPGARVNLPENRLKLIVETVCERRVDKAKLILLPDPKTEAASNRVKTEADATKS